MFVFVCVFFNWFMLSRQYNETVLVGKVLRVFCYCRREYVHEIFNLIKMLNGVDLTPCVYLCIYFLLIVESTQIGNLLCHLIYGNLQFSDTHLQLINQHTLTHKHKHIREQFPETKMFTLNANK